MLLKVLIVLVSILIAWLLVGYLAFYFYIRKNFIDQLLSSGEEKRQANRVWRRSRFTIIKMAYRILFRGE